MKRSILFLLAVLFCFPFCLYGQLSKGTWYASGSSGSTLPVAQGLAELSFLSQAGFEVNVFGLGISPEFGYFFSNNLLIGSRLSASLVGEEGGAFAVAPFARFYLNPQASNNHFFVNGQLSFLSASDDNLLGANLGVGMTHFLAPGIGLDAYLAVVKPDFEINRNTQLGLFTSLNVYLNPEQRATRKQALSALQSGSWMVGGTGASASINISSPRTGASGSRALNLNPNLLYFVSNRLAIGGAVNLALSGFGDGDVLSSSLGISPRVRYYLTTDRHRVWFLSGAYHYDQGKIKFNGEEIKNSVSRASVAAGLNSFFTPNLALELAPNLNYNFEAEALRVGLDLGIQFFLHPKR